MITIREEDIIAKGFNWVKTLDEFKYFRQDYSNSEIQTMLFNLKEFKISDGSRVFEGNVYTFVKKTDAELLKEKQDKDLNYQIDILENKFKIKISYDEL